MIDTADRWDNVRDAFASLAYEHLPPHLQAVSKPFHDLGAQLLEQLPDHRQLVFALDKLVEAKDCAVRVAVRARQDDGEPDAPSDKPLMIVVVADTITRGQLLVESRWRGVVVAVRRAEGLYRAGNSTVWVITPRTLDSLRGLTITDVYIDSYRAYNAIREALGPCTLTGDVRWLDESGELPEQP